MAEVLSLLASSEVWHRVLESSGSMILVALGGFLFLRAGQINLGLEGMMLVGAFAAAAGSKLSHSGSVGLACALALGAVVGVGFAVSTTWLRGDLLLTGIALNFIGMGATTLAVNPVFGGAGGVDSSSLRTIPRLPLPGLAEVPWLGTVLTGQTVLAYASVAGCAAAGWWLHRTRAGLTLKVVGTRPEVALMAGRSPTRTHLGVATVAGALIGAGGAQLSLGEVAEFHSNMTAGRGFIAIAIAMLIWNRVWAIIPISLAFALLDALSFAFQGIGYPAELSRLLPYLTLPAVFAARKLVRRFRRGGRAAPTFPHPEAAR